MQFHTAAVRCERWPLSSTRQKFDEFRGGDGPTEQVALHRVAAQFLQERQLQFGLDTFGDDSYAETVRECNGRLDDGGVVIVETETVGERAVDLEHVDREPFEVGERREPGTEVVERETDA